jgi:hypothetical protein
MSFQFLNKKTHSRLQSLSCISDSSDTIETEDLSETADLFLRQRWPDLTKEERRVLAKIVQAADNYHPKENDVDLIMSIRNKLSSLRTPDAEWVEKATVKIELFKLLSSSLPADERWAISSLVFPLISEYASDIEKQTILDHISKIPQHSRKSVIQKTIFFLDGYHFAPAESLLLVHEILQTEDGNELLDHLQPLVKKAYGEGYRGVILKNISNVSSSERTIIVKQIHLLLKDSRYSQSDLAKLVSILADLSFSEREKVIQFAPPFLCTAFNKIDALQLICKILQTEGESLLIEILPLVNDLQDAEDRLIVLKAFSELPPCERTYKLQHTQQYLASLFKELDQFENTQENLDNLEKLSNDSILSFLNEHEIPDAWENKLKAPKLIKNFLETSYPQELKSSLLQLLSELSPEQRTRFILYDLPILIEKEHTDEKDAFLERLQGFIAQGKSFFSSAESEQSDDSDQTIDEPSSHAPLPSISGKEPLQSYTKKPNEMKIKMRKAKRQIAWMFEHLSFSNTSLSKWGGLHEFGESEAQSFGYPLVRVPPREKHKHSYDHILLVQVDDKTIITPAARARFDRYGGEAKCSWIQLDPLKGKFRCVAGNFDKFKELENASFKLVILGHGSASDVTIGGYSPTNIWEALYKNELLDVNNQKQWKSPLLTKRPAQISLFACEVGNQSATTAGLSRAGILPGKQIPIQKQFGPQLMKFFFKRFGSAPLTTAYSESISINYLYKASSSKELVFRHGPGEYGSIISCKPGGKKMHYDMDEKGDVFISHEKELPFRDDPATYTAVDLKYIKKL